MGMDPGWMEKRNGLINCLLDRLLLFPYTDGTIHRQHEPVFGTQCSECEILLRVACQTAHPNGSLKVPSCRSDPIPTHRHPIPDLATGLQEKAWYLARCALIPSKHLGQSKLMASHCSQHHASNKSNSLKAGEERLDIWTRRHGLLLQNHLGLAAKKCPTSMGMI